MTKTTTLTWQVKEAFMAEVLAGTIPCDGLEGYGTVSLRQNDQNSTMKHGTVAYVKNGQLYVQYDHLPKPRLCRDFRIFDKCIEAALKNKG